MALVAASNSHGLTFCPLTHEWQRPKELHACHDTTIPREVSIIVNFSNQTANGDKIRPFKASVSSNDNLTKSALELSGCSSSKESDVNNVKGTCDPAMTDADTVSTLNRTICCAEDRSDSSHEQRGQELSDRLTQSNLLDGKSSFLDISHLNESEDSENKKCVPKQEDADRQKSGNYGRTCFRKKKRLKKIRQRSSSKWKPLHCAELGFNFLLMPGVPNEVANLNEDDTEEDCCISEDVTLSVVTQSEALEQAMSSDSSSSSSSHESSSDNTAVISDIDQNAVDDITFFQALGVDVVNFDCDDDEYDEFLHWDGIYFSMKMCASKSHLNTEKPDKTKVKSRIKSNITANGQTDSSLPVQVTSNKCTAVKTKVDTAHILPSPSIGLSRIKKCDIFKLFELECSSSKRIYIRRDRDRRKEKAHKAVKSKNCRSVLNNLGRKNLYMHHRLIKMHNLDFDFRGSVKSYRIPPMPKPNIALDVAKEVFRADRKARAREDRPAPVQNLHHALHEGNCTGHIEYDLASFLITLQHRDLTPEDYDMLLRLDDTVKPKTVSESVLERLRTETIGPEGPEQGSSDWEPLCTICMEPYITGQERKFLPCNHDFHTPCIDKWLTNSSLNCPLDGLPIEAS